MIASSHDSIVTSQHCHMEMKVEQISEHHQQIDEKCYPVYKKAQKWTLDRPTTLMFK